MHKKLVIGISSDNQELQSFYNSFKVDNKYPLKPILIMGILLTNAESSTKARLIFEVLDENNEKVLSKSHLFKLAGIIIDSAVEKTNMLVSNLKIRKEDIAKFIQKLRLAKIRSQNEMLKIFMGGDSSQDFIKLNDFVDNLTVPGASSLMNLQGVRKFIMKQEITSEKFSMLSGLRRSTDKSRDGSVLLNKPSFDAERISIFTDEFADTIHKHEDVIDIVQLNERFVVKNSPGMENSQADDERIKNREKNECLKTFPIEEMKENIDAHDNCKIDKENEPVFNQKLKIVEDNKEVGVDKEENKENLGILEEKSIKINEENKEVLEISEETVKIQEENKENHELNEETVKIQDKSNEKQELGEGIVEIHDEKIEMPEPTKEIVEIQEEKKENLELFEENKIESNEVKAKIPDENKKIASSQEENIESSEKNQEKPEIKEKPLPIIKENVDVLNQEENLEINEVHNKSVDENKVKVEVPEKTFINEENKKKGVESVLINENDKKEDINDKKTEIKEEIKENGEKQDIKEKITENQEKKGEIQEKNNENTPSKEINKENIDQNTIPSESFEQNNTISSEPLENPEFSKSPSEPVKNPTEDEEIQEKSESPLTKSSEESKSSKNSEKKRSKKRSKPQIKK